MPFVMFCVKRVDTLDAGEKCAKVHLLKTITQKITINENFPREAKNKTKEKKAVTCSVDPCRKGIGIPERRHRRDG